MTHAITTYRPGLLGHQVINEVFDNFFNDGDLFSNVLKQSTKGVQLKINHLRLKIIFFVNLFYSVLKGD